MLNRNIILNKLKSMKKYLEEKYFVKKIGLFGSYARNEQHENSDIDLVVEFSHPIGIEFVSLANEIESEFQTNIDLISIKSINSRYMSELENEIVYA